MPASFADCLAYKSPFGVKPRAADGSGSGRDSGSGVPDAAGQRTAFEQQTGAKRPAAFRQQQQQQQAWRRQAQSQEQEHYPLGDMGGGVEDSSQGVLEGRIYNESLVSSYLMSARVSHIAVCKRQRWCRSAFYDLRVSQAFWPPFLPLEHLVHFHHPSW